VESNRRLIDSSSCIYLFIIYHAIIFNIFIYITTCLACLCNVITTKLILLLLFNLILIIIRDSQHAMAAFF
jgi:hypothetical protein